MIEELFLRSNLASSQLFLEEFKEFLIFFNNSWDLRSDKGISWSSNGLSLWALDVIKEFSSVLVTISYSNGSTADSDVQTNSKVSWLEWHLRSVLLDNHLSIEELTLWGSTVDLLWLDNHD